ncbi:efflux RND transporter periplasmic adaptor subunit [Geothrix sp. 21YS21S-4]|uniref:efflux RND transporter periplasmic adaptor subunit n=1 Tax=Geothrix sp. 21YS21S-4 TaxID=3068889 RepID=UPI0027BAF62E|nr:efflux RND transporter periplasmic adaptor subunit [Geothrix sp. 21YS21S-4]
MKRNTWIGLGVGVAVVAGGTAYALTRPKNEVKWRQVQVDRGNVTQRINATGAVSPVVQVAVGTQVSGVISALYVDYNSIVKKGQLIAEIDPTVWETQLQDAQASLLRAQASYDFAKADYERSKRLAAAQLLADQDLETKETALKTAKGNLESAKASVDRAKANLDYCRITAPVDGVVISRLADVGQTVAASFSTPNLFQIAQDLSQMKVQVSIGESDIDELKVGQRAFFTVDSLPDKQFGATVSLVRQEPVTNNNVVNYVVEMIVPNEPLPGAEEAGKDAAAAPHAEQGHEAAPDPEKAWERMKDRMAAQGVTKEQFLKRFQERMAQGKAAGPRPAPPARSAVDAATLARIPGGASQLVGPKFTGSLALRSGMTANVTIVTNQRRDVLRVPNAALRFNPAAFVKDDKKADAPRLGQPMMMGGGPRPGGNAQSGTGSKGGLVAKREDRVWTLENGKPKAVVVKAGVSDGQFTEVSGEGIHEGLAILTGVENTKQAASASPLGTPGQGGGRR